MKYGRRLGACALVVLTVLVAGYLTVQKAAYAGGYLVGFDGLPALAVGRRYAWELDAAMVLFGIAAVAVYRRFAQTRGVQAVTRVTLIVCFLASATFMAMSSSQSGPVVAAGLGGLVIWAFVSGGTSSFTLALIALSVADLLVRRARGEAHADVPLEARADSSALGDKPR